MINLIKQQELNRDFTSKDLYPIPDLHLKMFLQLIVEVIPVSYIFCYSAGIEPIRLILVSDPYSYLANDEVKNIVTFTNSTQPSIQIIYREYGTVNDLLQRGDFFLSTNCIDANCIYKKSGPYNLKPSSDKLITALRDHASNTFKNGLKRAAEFYELANFYFEQEKGNLTAFLLHQTCEQVLRTLIILNKTATVRSHQLILLQKEAAFYYPALQNIFDDHQRKELKWLMLLQTAYVGARYEENYKISFADLTFLKDRLDQFLSRMELHAMTFI
ncbi:hypothetical protein ASE92_18255 [Pedobacter sp. Leaf41]|nr:hypothetical protein ASE92_18255 [Pedobacter sp. Leaf41]RZL69519.1 MAG: HEPN domain-containing protein [Pedobacter sp.]